MANRRLLLKAIETVRAGGAPPMALSADEAAALAGPDTMDCIAPADRLAGLLAGGGGRQARRRGVAAAGGQSRPPTNELRRALRRARRGPLRRPARRCWSASPRSMSNRCAWPGPTCTARSAARRWSAASTRHRCRRRFDAGVGMVSTLLLKDTSDRTAFKVFEPGASGLPRGLRRRQQRDPAARPGQLRGLALGARHRLDARRALVRRRHAGGRRPAPRAAACAGGAGRCRAGPALRARGRIPHLSHHRRAPGTRRRGLARPSRRRWRCSTRATSCCPRAGPTCATSRWPSCAAPRWRWGCRCVRWRSNWARASSRPCSAPPMRSPRPTRWCCSATACARRCGAPATTPASSAGRRSRVPWPAAGTCTTRWCDDNGDNAMCRDAPAPATQGSARRVAQRRRRALAGRTAGARPRHGRAVRTHARRLQPLPRQRDGAAGGAVGARQPRRHAARGGRSR